MNTSECDIYQPCGPREWDKLQKGLAPRYRLKIYEFKKGAPRLELIPIYKGTGNVTCLNILLDHDHDHYDTILSMPGVLAYPYYCDHCDVGYSHIEDYRTTCPYRCSLCLSDTPCAPDGISVQCSKCQGFFKSIECYQRHLKPYNRTDVTVCV